MSLLDRIRPAPLSGAVFVELVIRLYSALVPVAAIGVAITWVGLVAAVDAGDPAIVALAALAAGTTCARVTLILLFRRRLAKGALEVIEARRWERRYGAGSLLIGACIGLIGARAFRLEDPSLHLMAIGLCFGYCAGQVTRASVRPVICISSLIIAVAPIATSLALSSGANDLALAAFIVFFLIASFETAVHAYRMVSTHISTRLQLARLARHDPMTQLPNRLMLRERFGEAVAAAERDGRLTALLYTDLDHFKPVNDRYGHRVGDAVLKLVAERLNGVLRPGDIAVRLGGDEFVVLQVNIDDAHSAERLARRIIQTVGAPYRIEGLDIAIGASIGIALAPSDGGTLDELTSSADRALYAAKAAGLGTFRFFGQAMTNERRQTTLAG